MTVSSFLTDFWLSGALQSLDHAVEGITFYQAFGLLKFLLKENNDFPLNAKAD